MTLLVHSDLSRSTRNLQICPCPSTGVGPFALVSPFGNGTTVPLTGRWEMFGRVRFLVVVGREPGAYGYLMQFEFEQVPVASDLISSSASEHLILELAVDMHIRRPFRPVPHPRFPLNFYVFVLGLGRDFSIGVGLP